MEINIKKILIKTHNLIKKNERNYAFFKKAFEIVCKKCGNYYIKKQLF